MFIAKLTEWILAIYRSWRGRFFPIKIKIRNIWLIFISIIVLKNLMKRIFFYWGWDYFFFFYRIISRSIFFLIFNIWYFIKLRFTFIILKHLMKRIFFYWGWAYFFFFDRITSIRIFLLNIWYIIKLHGIFVILKHLIKRIFFLRLGLNLG